MLFKDLYIFYHEPSEKYLIYLETFLAFLRAHISISDTIQLVKRSNIIGELGTHKEKLYTANEKEAIPVLFLLKYIFQHSEQKRCAERVRCEN